MALPLNCLSAKMENLIQNYQIRANRGRPRVWIEGKRLVLAGFNRGCLFNVVVGDRGLTLTKVFRLWDVEGSRKVSGKGERPLIDLVGALLTQANLKSGDHVIINYKANSISIEAVSHE